MNHMENVTSKPLQATYLQMNDTHTTHWSVEYSVYMIGYLLHVHQSGIGIYVC